MDKEKKQRLISLLRPKRLRHISNDPPLSLRSFIKTVLNLGKDRKDIENLIANYFDAKRVFLTKTGRLAIYLFLKAIGVKERDEVIVSSFNCFVVPQAVLLAGAKPVYVEIGYDTNFRIDDLRRKISSNTKCIIVSLLDGISLDLEQVLDLASSNRMYVLVDGAHTLLYNYRGRPILHDDRVHGVIHSFSHSKMFSLMGGGILLLKDSRIATEVQHIYEARCTKPILAREVSKIVNLITDRLFGRYAYLCILVRILRKISYCEPEIRKEEYCGRGTETFYTRMSKFKLLLLYHNLVFFELWNETRRRYCKIYCEQLGKSGVKSVLQEINSSAPLHYPIIYDEGSEELFFYLIKNSVYIERWFLPSLYPAGYEINRFMYNENDYPFAANLSRKILNLPTSPRLQEREIRTICDLVIAFKNETHGK